MRTDRVVHWVCLLVAFAAAPARGSIAQMEFREMVKKSEIIVEGRVTSQVDVAPPPRLDDTQAYRKESLFEIEHVLKGDVKPGQVVAVRSHRNFICDTCRLRVGEQYILMLTGSGQGYVDINSGQGTWRILKLGARPFAVSSHSGTGGGVPLGTFRGRIAWSLRDPAPGDGDGGKPTISKDQARAAATKALAAAGVDLSAFQLRKVEQVSFGSTAEGFAHKGDPVWLCDWQKPGTAGKSPRPAGTFVCCYVHARSGAVSCIAPHLPDTAGQEDTCRLFLKSYPPFEKDLGPLADTARFTAIPEAELRKQAANVTRKFFRLEAKYPSRSRFFHAELPDDPLGRSILFVLYSGRHVHFTGVLSDTPPAGKPAQATGLAPLVNAP